jgi:hypothetical protein
MIKMYIGLHVKYHLFLSDFNETCNIATDFREISNFMKIRPVGAILFHASGHEANSRFSQFFERDYKLLGHGVHNLHFCYLCTCVL